MVWKRQIEPSDHEKEVIGGEEGRRRRNCRSGVEFEVGRVLLTLPLQSCSCRILNAVNKIYSRMEHLMHR